MRRLLKLTFLTVEVNLLLWLAMAGVTLRHNATPGGAAHSAVDLRWLAFIGVAFAAVVQHWAYYALYRRARELGVSDGEPRKPR